MILFGIPEAKDAYGSENYNPDGIVPQAIRAIKDAVPELIVISDMCFCEYTDHGHCGVINHAHAADYNPHLPEGYLLNDPTLATARRGVGRSRRSGRGHHRAVGHDRRDGRRDPRGARRGRATIMSPS